MIDQEPKKKTDKNKLHEQADMCSVLCAHNWQACVAVAGLDEAKVMGCGVGYHGSCQNPINSAVNLCEKVRTNVMCHSVDEGAQKHMCADICLRVEQKLYANQDQMTPEQHQEAQDFHVKCTEQCDLFYGTTAEANTPGWGCNWAHTNYTMNR